MACLGVGAHSTHGREGAEPNNDWTLNADGSTGGFQHQRARGARANGSTVLRLREPQTYLPHMRAFAVRTTPRTDGIG